MNKIEFLRESIIVLSKKIESIEKWCAKHEVEHLKCNNALELTSQCTHKKDFTKEELIKIANAILRSELFVEPMDESLILIRKKIMLMIDNCSIQY